MAKKQTAALVLVDTYIDGKFQLRPGQVVEADEALLKPYVADGSLDPAPAAVAHALASGEQAVAYPPRAATPA